MSWFKIRPAIAKAAPKAETAVEETLQSDHFQLAKVVRHGFPHQPTALAFDPVQNLLAIGTKSGSIRIIGRPGVDRHIQHEAEIAVIQVLFLINEGALVSVCADDQLHLWSLRQKKPEIIHALKFQREKITFCHLPFQSKWLYIGTQKGNVHVLNLESFVLSGYIINWNKTIELIRRTHPGPVVHLSANQSDPNKLLIGYETGLLTLWDLKSKVAECQFNCKETIKSVSWHHEGKQFICSHNDGSLTTWNVKSPQQSVSTILPHGKLGRDGKPETCRAINKVELCTNRSSDPFTVFSGGMPVEKAGQTPTLTIMHGSNTTVLEMEYQIIDFIVLCSTPWNNDFQDPYAVIVLLQNDFIVIDLTSPNYPCFENPCPMDIHESSVTACCYFSNCPTDLMPAFYSVGYRQKKTGFSEKEWPVKGGEWPSVATSYEEIIITGHADGSVKFWNAPGVTLQVLYKLKTAKLFDETQCNYGPDVVDSPLAVQVIGLCVESRLLCVAGKSHASLFRFSKQEAMIDCVPVEITIIYDISDGSESPDLDYPSLPLTPFFTSSSQSHPTCVKLKSGPRKWSSGYQPDLCCILTWVDGEPPSPISSVAINSKFGLLVLGNDAGLAVVDILQKTCLLSIGTPDMYGSMDPYSRSPRSPKLKSSSRSQGFEGPSYCMTPDDVKSPNIEQLGIFLSSPVQPKTSLCNPFDSAFKSAEHSAVNKRTLDSCNENLSIDRARAVAKQPSVEKSFGETRKEARGSVHRIQGESCIDRDRACLTDGELNDMNKNKGKRSATNNYRSSLSGIVPLGVRRRSAVEQGSHAKERSRLHLNLPERNSSEKKPVPSDKIDLNSSYPFVKSLPDVKCAPLNTSSSIGADSVDRNCVMVPQTAPVLSKADGQRVVGKMNRRLKSYLKFASGLRNNERDVAVAEMPENEDGANELSVPSRAHRTKSRDVELVDLTSDDIHTIPFVHKVSHAEISALDRTDSSTFSRSQSSSMSSLDNVSKETIQCLVLGEFCIRKSDCSMSPCLWAGTSLGSVLVLSINLPTDNLARRTEPISASPSGTVFRLKGAILALAFVDANGVLIPCSAESWRDLNRDESAKERKPYFTGQQSTVNLKVNSSLSSTDNSSDQQFAVLCSEKQARVVALPSQTCISKVKVSDTSSAIRAEVVQMKDSSCLACYIQSGRIVIFTLPSLKPLLDVDLVSSPDARVAQTLCLSSNCNILYFCSPSELQKITLSAEMCENLNDMLGELFVPRDMPEPPKQGFFQTLFNMGSATLDREELFGERSGKPARGVAKYTSGISQAQESANLACSEIGRAKMAAIERGEKLGELDERTTQMMLDAELFSQRANQMKNKYKDRKWYQF